jgi:hypothetical protein
VVNVSTRTIIATIGGGATAYAQNSSAPLYICAGALNSNTKGGGLHGDLIGTSYSVDQNDGDADIAAVGHQSMNGCESYSNNSPDPVVSSAISISGLDVPHHDEYTFIGAQSGSLSTNTSLTFQVNNANVFAAIAVACGYSACDNTTQAQVAGSTGYISVPLGCKLQTSEDLDGYENSSIYTCNSLAPGSYDVYTTNNGAFGGAEIAIGAYVFQNVTGNPKVGYAEYDNGRNVFSFYDNFAGNQINSSDWEIQSYSGSNYNVNNGLYVNSSAGGFVYLLGQIDAPTQISDMYIASATPAVSQIRIGYSLDQNNPTNYDSVSDPGLSETNYQIESWDGSFGVTDGTLPTGLAAPYIQSFGWTGSNQTALINYTDKINGSDINYSYEPTSYLSSFITYSTSSSYSTSIYWYRDRIAPPDEIMPASIFGSPIFLISTTTTIPHGGGGGSGGSSGGGGGLSGSGGGPTIQNYTTTSSSINDSINTTIQTGFMLLNFTNDNCQTLQLEGGKSVHLCISYITSDNASVIVNNNTYTLSLNHPVEIDPSNNLLYFINLLKIHYAPILHAVNLLVYAQQQSKATTSTTITQSTNITAKTTIATINTGTTLSTTIYQQQHTSSTIRINPIIPIVISVLVIIVIFAAYTLRIRPKHRKRK